MALDENRIESLPMELLRNVFSHVDDRESIQQARLVSKSFNHAATPYLVVYASVAVTSKSLSRLEDLCNHPVFGKSITHVSIVLSQYDVGMAADRSLFLQDLDTRLFQHLEMYERMNPFRNRRRAGKAPYTDAERAIRDQALKTLWAVSSNREILKISEEGFDESLATPFQQLAMRLYAMYKQRCDDQEEVRRDNKHISRLCFALAKLPNLQHLRLHDRPHLLEQELKESDFQDLGLERSILWHFDSTLSPSKSCGSFTTAYSIVPPLEMIGELCARLGQSGLRPRAVTMSMATPANLRPMALSPDQQLGLRLLVSRATNLELTVDGWARKNSLAENNDRPRDEMLALCSFTQPFFSAPDLKNLHIYFVEFPRFYQTPTVSLSDILPLDSSWPHLNTLTLKYQPATIDDLRALVALQKNTVKNFTWECGWLLSGRWDEAVEALRGFQGIEKVSMDYPRGERYGQGHGSLPDMPYDDVYNYILKETHANPLPSEPTS